MKQLTTKELLDYYVQTSKDLKESTELCSRLQLESVNKDIEIAELKHKLHWLQVNCGQ